MIIIPIFPSKSLFQAKKLSKYMQASYIQRIFSFNISKYYAYFSPTYLLRKWALTSFISTKTLMFIFLYIVIDREKNFFWSLAYLFSHKTGFPLFKTMKFEFIVSSFINLGNDELENPAGTQKILKFEILPNLLWHRKFRIDIFPLVSSRVFWREIQRFLKTFHTAFIKAITG